MKTENLKFHEYANIFPLMESDKLDELAKDIKENGLRDSIKLYDGQILDGRNRFRACLQVDVEPRFEEMKIERPLQYVVSLNMHRRHLSESQRAWIAANIANLQICTQYDASKMMNVSERSIASAAEVKRKAIPELCEAVQEGKIPVSIAAKIVKLDKNLQQELVPMNKKERLQALKEIKKKDFDGTLKIHNVKVQFTDEQLKMIDNAIKRFGEKGRADFIQGVVVNFCQNGLPPKMSELKGMSPKSFIKEHYKDEDTIPGKRGISKQEEDEAKEYDRLASRASWFCRTH
jgi:hypothetical protein